MKQCRFTFTWAVVVILACLPPCTLSAFAQEKPVSQEELQEVRDALDTLNASVKQYRGIVDALRKIKVSGFLQPQFRYADVMDQPYSIGLYSGGAFPQYSKTQIRSRAS